MSAQRRQACGTNAGYHQHIRRNEPPCAGCKAAKRQHDRDRYAADDEAHARALNRARAQTRALTRLKAHHEIEYYEQYDAARLADGSPTDKPAYSRARSRALKVLRRRYVREYAALYTEELQLQQEATP